MSKGVERNKVERQEESHLKGPCMSCEGAGFYSEAFRSCSRIINGCRVGRI